MITWSSCQSRPRVTHRVRYSVSTMGSVMTLRSKGLSTVSLLVPPMVMITKESWLLGYNWLVHNLQVLRLVRSSSLGSSRCLPDVSRDLSYILLIMGFELTICLWGIEKYLAAFGTSFFPSITIKRHPKSQKWLSNVFWSVCYEL